MKQYTVVPDRDVNGWFVKIEDTAPADHYDVKTDAIEYAEKIAKENAPSKLSILDKNLEVEEERTF